ncbi:MAG: TRAM domain-containing protein [Verrucomicrobiae bacterium]|nr:TRAM domain-containing protein [Verrucomicrobiae bacterium]
MERTVFIFRIFFLTVCAVGGYFVAEASNEWSHWTGLSMGIVVGLLVILCDRLLKGISLRAFSSATFGLALGCILAQLLTASRVFQHASEDTQWIIYLAIYLVFGYLGMMLALRSNKDEFSLIIPYVRFRRADSRETPWVLDTSAVVDGRIADLVKSGFIEGTLSVPRYVLEEVQRLADSTEPNRRAKGRRAQDTMDALKKSDRIEFHVPEGELEAGEQVDAKLVHLSRLLNARLITTDYNLQKTAELQGIAALNINDLSKATRPVALPGEVLEVKLVKEGKDEGQAVGYLSDGTMIVVNAAKSHIGKLVHAEVASILQTTAGRLVFADLKHVQN